MRRADESKAFGHDGYSSMTALSSTGCLFIRVKRRDWSLAAIGLAEWGAHRLTRVFEQGMISGAQVDVLMEAR